MLGLTTMRNTLKGKSSSGCTMRLSKADAWNMDCETKIPINHSASSIITCAIITIIIRVISITTIIVMVF